MELDDDGPLAADARANASHLAGPQHVVCLPTEAELAIAITASRIAALIATIVDVSMQRLDSVNDLSAYRDGLLLQTQLLRNVKIGGFL